MMKLKSYVEKIGQNGEIKIPPDYLKSLGLCPGEEVELKLAGRHLLMEPVRETVASKASRRKSISDQLYGAMEVSPEIAEKVLSNDYPFNPEDV